MGNHKPLLWPFPYYMILAQGLLKDGGSVSAPCLIMSNDGSTLIGKNIHDTDPTVSSIRVDDSMMR